MNQLSELPRKCSWINDIDHGLVELIWRYTAPHRNISSSKFSTSYITTFLLLKDITYPNFPLMKFYQFSYSLHSTHPRPHSPPKPM